MSYHGTGTGVEFKHIGETTILWDLIYKISVNVPSLGLSCAIPHMAVSSHDVFAARVSKNRPASVFLT